MIQFALSNVYFELNNVFWIKEKLD